MGKIRYKGSVTAKATALLLGGVKKNVSSPMDTLRDVLAWVDAYVEGQENNILEIHVWSISK